MDEIEHAQPHDVDADLISDLMENNSDKTEINELYWMDHTPGISLHYYIEERLLKYVTCERYALRLAYTYMLHLKNEYPSGLINMRTIYKIVLVTFMIAIKFCHDKPHNNKYFAQVGGVSIKDLNDIEIYTLYLIKFNIMP